jgi:3-oxoadipate enol-lactonase
LPALGGATCTRCSHEQPSALQLPGSMGVQCPPWRCSRMASNEGLAFRGWTGRHPLRGHARVTALVATAAPGGHRRQLGVPMPFTAGGLYYDVTDLRPAWSRERATHRPIVFHHGVGANLEIFDEWIPTIARRHPVARFDMRGFGRSIVPPETHVWTMTELIDDLLEVGATAFGTEPVHVMGESIGGTIALAACLSHPARYRSVAMSNAAFNGGHIGYAAGWRSEIASVGIDGWSKRMMEMRFVPGAAPPQALAWFADVQARSRAHVVVGLGELLIATDLTGELAACASPLLVMMPDRSPFVSLLQMGVLVERVPQAEIAVFPGARHGLPFSHATQAARTLLDFLERVESGASSPARAKPPTRIP